MSAQAALERGFRALEAWSWPEARAAFEEALAADESAEALEGLGVAATWQDDLRASTDARERAFLLYRDRGDADAAARVAAALADAILMVRGDSAVAAGWLQRARRVLAERPDSPVLAWVDTLDAFLAMAYERDVARAVELGETAVARARAMGDTDMEMVAVSVQGVVLVSSGRFEAGMRLLDEATASAATGDVKNPEAAAQVCCALVTAAVRVRDFDRLAEWSRYVMDLSRGWPNRAMFSYPRTEHAIALTWWGRWQEAERELEGVIADMDGRPLLAALAQLRLSDLRRRQGRYDEGWAMLDELDQRPSGVHMGHLTGAVRAAIAFDRGDAVAAMELAERYLRAVPTDDVVERADGLEIVARAAATRGDTDRGAEAVAELEGIAEQVPTRSFRAAVRLVSGVMAAAKKRHEPALGALEEAAELYDRSEAPFEAARARVELARTLLALERHDAAAEELRRALGVFEALGASADAERVSADLGLLPAATGKRRDVPLTDREVEVLRLIATGATNEEIATTLVLSIRTVERHISNIYSKIGSHGRTARAVATAYAHTHALT